MISLPRIILATAITGALGMTPCLAQDTGHLDVPATQHVQLTFHHQDSDLTNVFRIVDALFPDGTSVPDFRIPAGYALVITDIHMQIARLAGDVSAPLDGVLQLSTSDRDGSDPGVLLVTLPMSAAANQRRTAFSHSFTAGFTFSGKKSPVLSPIVFGGEPIDGQFLQASGYLVSIRRHR